MTDSEAVSSDDTTPGGTVPNVQLYHYFTNFYQDQIGNLQEKLEAATFRNGYLESESSGVKTQLMLLPDLQARASKTEELKLEIQRLERQLREKKDGWLTRFDAWLIGRKTNQ